MNATNRNILKTRKQERTSSASLDSANFHLFQLFWLLFHSLSNIYNFHIIQWSIVVALHLEWRMVTSQALASQPPVGTNLTSPTVLMPEDWTKTMKHGVRTAMIKNRIYRWSFLRNRRWVAGVHQASVCIFFRSRTVERNPKLSSQNKSYLCYYWKELIFFQTKLKGGTYQMKALDQDWADSNGTVCVTTEESSFSRKRNLKYVSTQMQAVSMSTF